MYYFVPGFDFVLVSDDVMASTGMDKSSSSVAICYAIN